MRASRRRLAAALSIGLAGVIALSGCEKTAEEAGADAGEHAEFTDEQWQPSDPSKSPKSAENRTDSFVSVISKPGGVFLPGFYDNGWDGNAIQPIFSSLVVRDDSGTPQPDLAESWEVSDDKLTYTYHLRDNLKFSDGSSLTSEDVKFTLTLLNDPEYSGGQDFSDIGIVGAEDYKAGKADDISGIKVIDSTTVEITTEKVNPLALTTLGGQIISKDYYGKDYSRGKLDYLRDLYGKPVGAGPYALDKYVEGQEIRYKANPNYYGGEPKIATVIFKVLSTDSTLQNFQNGEIDHGGFGSDPANIKELQNLGYAGIKARVIPDIGQIWVNNKHEPLGETSVRQALHYGLDRQQIVDVKFKGLGKVADTYAAPPQWSYTEDGVTKYDFDAEKANSLLDESGWEKNSDGVREKDGKPLKISYITTDQDDPVIPIAEQNYKDLGIDFTPEVLDSNTAFSRFNEGDYDLAGFRTNGLEDPDDAVNEFGSDNPAVNVSGYDNPEVKELIAKGTSTFDEGERKKIYAELYQKLSEDPPSILLDYRKSISAWNARIQGGEDFVTGSSDSSLKLAQLSIDTPQQG